MNFLPIGRAWTALVLAIVAGGVARPAQAQFQPRPIHDIAMGERYHVEASAGYWFPTADISISSQSLGIPGTTIDFKRDLGLTDDRFPEYHLELRPARSHKFRLQYIPIAYTQSSTITRDIVFNGQRYRIGLPVNSTLDWKAYRFGYEYDFITKDRVLAGFILDLKYTDVSTTLTSTGIKEFARSQAPIPALGGVVRGYIIPNLSLTGEVTGFTLPEKALKNNTGYYVDVNIYAMWNFTNNLGVQAGYRSIDLGYELNDSTRVATCPNAVGADAGCLKLQGLFFGVVARY
jgi:hypothetical protein